MSTEEKVSKFIELFETLPDERQEWKTKHKLIDILFIAVICTIANCDDWEDIEWFANLKIDWFKKHLLVPTALCWRNFRTEYLPTTRWKGSFHACADRPSLAD